MIVFLYIILGVLLISIFYVIFYINYVVHELFKDIENDDIKFEISDYWFYNPYNRWDQYGI